MSDVYGSGGEGTEPEIVWCPACGIHLPEGPNTLRVRADGIRRHIDCDTPVRTEEQHARDLASDEVEMPAVTGLLNKLGVEGTAYLTGPVGAPHVAKKGMTISTCACAMTHDHDAFGREIVVGPFDGNGFQVMDKAVADRLTEVRHDLEKQINATMGIPPALAGRGPEDSLEEKARQLGWVKAHRLFAPDPEVQLIVDSLADRELCRHQRDARTCTECPGLEFPRPVDQFRAPGASKTYDAARLAMRQALIADILSGTLTREKPPLYSEAEHLAENLLDSGWIPSTDRMAR